MRWKRHTKVFFCVNIILNVKIYIFPALYRYDNVTEDIVNFNLTVISECILEIYLAFNVKRVHVPSPFLTLCIPTAFFFLIMYDVSCLERRFACAVKRQLYLLKNIISQKSYLLKDGYVLDTNVIRLRLRSHLGAPMKYCVFQSVQQKAIYNNDRHVSSKILEGLHSRRWNDKNILSSSHCLVSATLFCDVIGV